MQDGDHQPRLRNDRESEIDPMPLHQLIAVPGRVEQRVLAQRLADGHCREGEIGQAHPLPALEVLLHPISQLHQAGHIRLQ